MVAVVVAEAVEVEAEVVAVEVTEVAVVATEVVVVVTVVVVAVTEDQDTNLFHSIPCCLPLHFPVYLATFIIDSLIISYAYE